LPGYDFMLTDGPDPERYPDLLGYQCLYNGFDFCITIEAGLFMHELGHNLNLRHGGFEDQNFKPNYISVMNYANQSGIYFGAVPGSIVPAGVHVDYSHAALPTLDPNHLDERVGLDGPPQGTNMQFYYGCTASPCYGGNIVYGFVPEASGPVDWNRDGAIEADEAVELNLGWWEDFYLGQFYPGTPMQGFDDWSAVRAFINAPPYKTGALPRGQGVPEPANRPRPAT
jgi:hypothetical protein